MLLPVKEALLEAGMGIPPPTSGGSKLGKPLWIHGISATKLQNKVIHVGFYRENSLERSSSSP